MDEKAKKAEKEKAKEEKAKEKEKVANAKKKAKAGVRVDKGIDLLVCPRFLFF